MEFDASYTPHDTNSPSFTKKENLRVMLSFPKKKIYTVLKMKMKDVKCPKEFVFFFWQRKEFVYRSSNLCSP